MQIVIKKINDLIEYENNPRDNDKAVDAVASSIKSFGFKVPIIIDANCIIIAGHTRLKAAKHLGLTDVPCIVADDLSDEQIKAFRLADNKVSEFATWDLEKLAEELKDIDGFDMSMFGFDTDAFTDDIKDDNFDLDKEYQEEAYSQLGDIYLLGKHKLMCGDSTKAEDFKKLLGDELIDLVVTDPPYNVNVGAKGDNNEQFDNRKIKNDNMSVDDFLEFLDKCFKNMFAIMKPGANYYVCHASTTLVEFDKALTKNNLKPRQQLIWNKNTLVLGRQDYQWKHECIYYGFKEGKAHYFTNDRTKTTVIDSPSLDFKSMKKDELVNRLESIYRHLNYSVLNHDKPTKNDLHPTMKPISLIAELIKNSSKKDDKILDLFGGSGSTMIASEELGRTSYLMELDENFVDVIVRRYINLKGSLADCYLIRDGLTIPLADIEFFA